ncbi:MAG: hypothetical protein COU81_00585 [Candidatus Portnoybacteria bacterium CG10_big_fil_rev_8_21_14_0_10_36_7]|uniref:Uncharacterized protein n=1 Tax=Candidatus Portnoybacteria bacterium CG10_big_fil_rev_8_21_14_0_10_36_7 TaxID=1974812 RepID=A0A2M8KEW6_9BACT|nr:MAG: hypothetical protein COU81_00585 [Candidatus Portnoybacteria bacterium CG10_big_fil_rev_8_21_14_0_10_36_7]
MYLSDGNEAFSNSQGSDGTAYMACIGRFFCEWCCNGDNAFGHTPVKDALEPYLTVFPMDPKERDYFYVSYNNSATNQIEIWSLIEDENNCKPPFNYYSPQSNNNYKPRCGLVIPY